MRCAQAKLSDVKVLLDLLQKGFLNPNKYFTQGIKKIAGILVLLTILEEESLQIPDKAEEFLKINFPADIATANFDLCLEILHSLHRHWPINLRLERNNLLSESLVFRQEMEHPSGLDSDLHIQNIALQIINEVPFSSGKNLKLPEIETVEQRRIDAGFDSKEAVNDLIERAIDLLEISSIYKRGVIIDGRKGVYSTQDVQDKLQTYFKSSKISLLVESDTDNQIKKIIRDFYKLLTPFLMSENNQNHE